MITKNNIFRNNLALRFVMAVLLLSTVFISCEKDFDQLVFPEDVLSPGDATRLSAIAGEKEVTLTWAAPIDFDLAGYVISYAPNGKEDIKVDKVNKLVVGSLENNVEYTFTVKTIDALGNLSKGTIIKATPKIIALPKVSFTENFDTSCPNLPSGWVSFSVASNINWACVDPLSNGNFALQGNGFGADAPANDWLITPALNLPVNNKAILNFKYTAQFSDAAGFGLKVLVSKNYSGTGSPNNATWEVLDAGVNNSLNSGTFTASKPVSMATYSGNIHIAFQYTSSGTGGGTTLRARVDDVSIAEPILKNFPFAENFESSCPAGLPTGWVKFSAASNIDWACATVTTNFVQQGNGFGADAPANDWLITPGIDLATANIASLKFKYSVEFADAAGFGLKVLLSKNYSGSGNPANATWEVVNAGVNNSLSSNVLTNASPVSLSSYSGTLHFAFQYTSSGVGSGTTTRVRIDEVIVN